MISQFFLGVSKSLDLPIWQKAIDQYSRTLDEYILYQLTDDPWTVSLRHLYTRTEITDTTGSWPPVETGDPYDEYSSMFKKVNITCRSTCSRQVTYLRCHFISFEFT